MDTLFQGIKAFNSDFYIADYTEAAKTEAAYKGHGVEITTVVPKIDYLCFSNTKSVVTKVANFEENLKVFTDATRKTHSQYECGCFTTNATPWFALVELKYCYEANIRKNAKNALSQIKATYD